MVTLSVWLDSETQGGRVPEIVWAWDTVLLGCVRWGVRSLSQGRREIQAW